MTLDDLELSCNSDVTFAIDRSHFLDADTFIDSVEIYL